MSPRSVFAVDRRTSALNSNPYPHYAFPSPHGLLSFQFAGVSNCRRQKSPANRAQFINDSPPDTDSTSYTAVYRCGRVFHSKSHPTDTRPSDSSGWPAERGFVFVRQSRVIYLQMTSIYRAGLIATSHTTSQIAHTIDRTCPAAL